MKCPVCKDVTLLMSEKNGVEIDYCPECRGVWLDRGELEKIMERARQAEDAYERQARDVRPPRAEAGRRDDDHGYGRDRDRDRDYAERSHRDGGYSKKRKSPFSEIFELFGGEDD